MKAPLLDYHPSRHHLCYTTTDPICFLTHWSTFQDSPTSPTISEGTPGRGLFFPRLASLYLMRFSHADWGGCPDSRRYISGYCFSLAVLLFPGDPRNKPLLRDLPQKQSTWLLLQRLVSYNGFVTCRIGWLIICLVRICLMLFSYVICILILFPVIS